VKFLNKLGGLAADFSCGSVGQEIIEVGSSVSSVGSSVSSGLGYMICCDNDRRKYRGGGQVPHHHCDAH